MYLVFNSFDFFYYLCVGHKTTFGSLFSPSLMLEGLGIRLRLSGLMVGGHLSPQTHLSGPIFNLLGMDTEVELLGYGNLFLSC